MTIPWIKARATGAPAGLLARGSGHDALPSQTSHDLASGPVAAPSGWDGSDVHRARRLQLQGQPRSWKLASDQTSAPHSRLSSSRGTGAIFEQTFHPARSRL